VGGKTQSKQTVCVFCKKPITSGQRPAVMLQPGKQVHIECWIKHQQDASKPN